MVGVIADDAGRILTSKRADHVHQGGRWEFPGGKLMPGELPEHGLARELNEELGIQVTSSRPLIRIRHDDGEFPVLLDVRRVEAYSGFPEGREGQPLAWQAPEAMNARVFPDADRAIIDALRLPPLLMITGDDPRQTERFLERIAGALERGIRLVQLRAHLLDDGDYARLAQQIYPLCEAYRARLLLNRDPRRIADVPHHGLHLTASLLRNLTERPGQPQTLIGASCHDAAQLAQAARLKLNYALLSPVKPTASHPLAVPLGWRRFAELAESANLPVYALGGLEPGDLHDAIDCGAQGIAAIRGLWPAAPEVGAS